MDLKSCAILFFPAFALTLLVNAQSGTPPSSWPQSYPGMPNGDYSPEWQACASTYTSASLPRPIHPISLPADFQVTNSLPNVTWPLARNWAGNLAVQREGHPNDTLFFWAFESSNGSFTAPSNEPWGIWLNGG